MNKHEFKPKQQAFLAYLKETKKISDNTHRSYASDLTQFAQFWQELEEPLTLTQALEYFISTLYQTGIDKSSIARKISCFNSLKKFLLHQGIELPLTIKRPLIVLKQPQILSIKEIFNLMDTIKDEELPTRRPLRDRAILELLYATGIQCSELVAIECQHVDLSQQSIIIRSKRKKERIVLFGPQARERILAYVQRERPEAQSSHERLFLNHRNQPLSARSIQRICVMFRDYMHEHYNLTPHILRHSFAIHLLSNGVDIDTLQELLGHKTRLSTQRYLTTIARFANS